jgi:integrase
MPGGKRTSTKIPLSQRSKAEKLFEKLQKKAIEGKLHLLDESKRITVEDWRDEYTQDRAHMSKDTVRADKTALNALIDVVGKDTPLRLVARNIPKFVNACLARGMKPGAVNNYLRHIRAALNTAATDAYGYLKTAPKIKLLKTPKRLHRVMSKEEIKNFFPYVKKAEFEFWRKFQFALWTGCRRSEILNARWERVSGGMIKIIGKGNKERKIPLLPGALEAMGDTKDIGPIFEPCHKDTLSQKFKEHAVACGIADITLHTLRHTAATYMLSKGIGIKTVQKILGHVDIRTTEIYVEVWDEVMAKEMQKLSFD